MSTLKGKTYEELYGEERAAQMKQRARNTALSRSRESWNHSKTPWNKGKRTPDETREKQRQAALNRSEGSKNTIIEANQRKAQNPDTRKSRAKVLNVESNVKDYQVFAK